MKITAYKSLNGNVYENKLSCTVADLEYKLSEKVGTGPSVPEIDKESDLRHLIDCGKMASEILRLKEKIARPIPQPAETVKS